MRKRRRRIRLFVLAVLILLAVVISAGVGIARLIAGRKAVPAGSDSAAVSAPLPQKGEIVISAAGDCTLGTDPKYGWTGSFDDVYRENGKNAAYFFENVADIFREDDLTFVNFEGTLTEATEAAEKTYTFKGPAEYTEILKSGNVDVVSLANNHTYDFLDKGLSDTKEALEKAEIPYAKDKKTALLEVGAEKIRVGIAAFAVWYDDSEVRASIREAIESLRRDGAELVFVSCHWGIEKDARANDTQKAIGHFAIDAGADGVFGHHPHVIQGIEKYKGKEIVYSLGNFCFGGNTDPADKDAFIFQLIYETEDGKLTGEKKSRVIPCLISSVSERNNYKPTVAEGKDAERIRERVLIY